MARQTVMPMANSLKVDCQATADADFTVDRTSSPKMSENRTKRIERPRIGSGPEEIVCHVSTYGFGSIIQEKNTKRTYSEEEGCRYGHELVNRGVFHFLQDVNET